MKNKKSALIMLLIIGILITLPLNMVFGAEKKKEKKETDNEPNIKVYSEAAILLDSNTGKIMYEKNAKERKYPASTTKILTAILTIENCNLDDKVVVDYDSISIVPSGYSVAALQVGEELTVKELLQVLLVHSANDAANVLGRHVGGTIDNFAEMMNKKASEIGCKDSHFVNPSGKHDDNHYTTAYDLSLIMNYCMKNETFRELASSKSCIIPATNKYEERVFTNTNELLVVDTRDIESNYYYQYAIAGKTGYTSEAKNCLVSVAKKDDLELICVVLGALRTDNGLSARFVDTKQLFEYGYNTYTIRKLREKGSIANEIEVQNATKDTKNLELLLTDDITVLIKQKDINSDIKPEIKLNDNICAPISQGDVLGTINYNIEGIEYSSKIIASHSVEKENYSFLIFPILIGSFVFIIIIYKVISKKKIRRRKTKFM